MSDARTPDIVQTALARFKLSADAFKAQRLREIEDLQFQVPELQWDPSVRDQRKGQIIDGVPVPARPMLSINKINQPIQLIANQERASHLGVQVSPLDEAADDETSAVIQDIYRGIERDCRAWLARSWAFDRGLKAGLGWYRILTEYAKDGGHPTDQRIVIKRILNQANVYPDPFAQEPDWSDGDWLLYVDDIPLAQYRQQYPKSKLAGMEDGELSDLGSEQPGWVNGDDASRAVRIAEYFYRERVPAPDGVGPEQITVHWCKINAVEKLDSRTIPGEFIPFIPVIGNELQIFDQERRWFGIIRPARDAQQAYNYEFSAAVEASALGPVAPWVGVEGSFEGHETKWAQANTRRFPYLEYKQTDLKGRPIVQVPTRTIQSADISSQLLLLEKADDAIQATTFTPDPSLGNLNARDRSGKAIQALQQQADIGNSNYIQNLRDISVLHEARIILSWIPHYYDRPGRRVRTVKPDDSEAPVIINAPFYTDPKTKRPVPVDPMQPPPVPPDQIKQYDLNKGIYGVAVTVGKSYATGRKEGADALGTLVQAVPAVFPILGPLWAQFQDWPGHEEAAKLLKKMQPPQLQQDESGQPSVEQLQGMLEQGKQAFQQLQQQAQEMKQALDTEQAKQQAAIEIAKTKEQSSVAIEQMKIDAELEKARIEAQAKIAVEQIKAQMTAARAQFDAEIANEREAAGAERESVEAERGRAHEREMAEMGHLQALESQEQQAALQPPPEAGV